MTAQEVRLCGLLLQEHFGDVVENVGTHLIRNGVLTLRALAHETKLALDLVKKSLCVLVQHGMCTFGPGRRGPAGPVEYHINCEHILHMLRYPRYIYTAKSLYGDTGELIVEEILQRGQMTMSSTVKTVADRLTHNMPEGQSMDYNEVVSAFSRLVETHFLQRCPPMASAESSGTGSAETPPAVTQPSNPESHPDCYKLPYISLSGHGKRRRSSEDGEADQRAAKKAKTDSSECGDEGIHWQVNFERFHLHFRDQAIISAVSCKLDQTSGEIVRTMLRMSEVTTSANAAFTQALSANEIFRALPSNYNIARPILDQYLTLLVDDPMEFVGKAGDSGGGMFVVNLHRALANLARATLESVVQERFGSRSARIFRLLLRKRHLEQKQVEDFAMIPAKEAKEMLYTLLSENLVQLQEIPKTPDHAPSRTFYLYAVNQLPTARLLLQHCYKTVGNLIERRLYETKENKRLLEKSQRIEAILASLQATGAEATQLTEVEEMITAPERQQLESLRHHINKLDSGENQVDETIFLLESYINSTQASR
ncbi:DNA-directed RNA polymerase III subunit RPC3 [Danio rerio]|uniref:DNA-directed RNA polymerase III subunit RPC3 n=1 Tax=Danio rerio TaxID=7955 RepID=RPC3_DANRE|nr:DNA-directed RNA polymerase III subunit RPC3 [Danio rerio]Q7ZUX1.1 RecName: Full=DNA-directed RNA polymerase III subunit RPC3; Short=RNA polymerase III subunit C3; AltName: Full=DNA-directed RNA polymerase III subunit C [Danio rerio]AAH46092.1 Polymerase (RNA) III (DNA directed) polypeptide C [Danio rerio]|eukprot:NP_956526.1 DNA-directed RNA polymerase III subunit RPC3 [Danio rerio]